MENAVNGNRIEDDPENYQPDNVVRLAVHNRRVPAITDEELLAYRELFPKLRIMLSQWERVTRMCPMASRIVEGDE